MEDAFFEHFSYVFAQPATVEHSINFADIRVDAASLMDLDLPFTTDKVWKAVQEPPADRAPGPES